MSVLGRFVAVTLVAALLSAATFGGLVEAFSRLGHAAHTSPQPPIVLSHLATRSYIYNAAGGEMAVLYADEDREEVPISSVPMSVQRSVIGIEDRDFYKHGGVDARSTFRALFSNIESGSIEQGGSTITQQLVKNAILGNEQTISRKLKEAALAIRLENQMSKKQILERYLNTVYLGHGAYGVQAGAETYWNTTVDKLSWPEAALITALIRNPVGYDPIAHPQLAAERRALVARRLRTEKIITSAQEKAINSAPIPSRTYNIQASTGSDQLAGANYFSETVKQQLLDMPQLGATAQARYDAVFKGGLRVTTTYNPIAQSLAEKAVALLPNTNGKYAAALASVDPANGAVEAIVGGSNFDAQQFNYATQGWRQPGSSFKFFTLMAAFQYAGAVPTDTISGSSPCKFTDPGSPGGVYIAHNDSGGGKTNTIDGQTLVSSNCAFLRLAQYVGLDKVAALADAMGITTLNPVVGPNGKVETNSAGNPVVAEGPVPTNVLSMPIGSKEVHPLDMAAAYATAADDGVYHAPYFIQKVTDANGKVLYQHDDPGTRVVSVETARLVTQVLAHNVTSGTGTKARLTSQPAAGKTGTTQDNADVWFVGYTPRLATAVWIGSPDGLTPVVLKGETQFGADWPSRIWRAFMQGYHQNLPVVQFPKPFPTRRGKYISSSNTSYCGSSSSSYRSSKSSSSSYCSSTRYKSSTSTKRPTTHTATSVPTFATSPPATQAPAGPPDTSGGTP